MTTPAISPAASPAQQFVASNAQAAKLRVGSWHLKNLVQQQPVFGLEGDGPPSTQKLVPQSRAAAQLLAGPAAKQFEQILRGSLSALDGRKGVLLKGVSLSWDRSGYVANLLVDGLDADPKRLAELTKATSTDVTTALEDRRGQYREQVNRVSASYQPRVQRVVLGPTQSLALLLASLDGRKARSVAAQKAQYVLGHELEHAVTPDIVTTKWNTGWLEEGTAELLSLQQHAANDRAKGTHIGSRPIVAARREAWLNVYSGYYHDVRSLLGLAGVNPTTRRGYDQARDLLQSGLINNVPRKLAAEIVKQHDLDPLHASTVEAAIKSIGGDIHAKDIRTLVRQLAKMGPAAAGQLILPGEKPPNLYRP